MNKSTQFFEFKKRINSVKLNGKIITFLMCLLLSGFFWLLMSLSKEYTSVLKFPVNYINIPQDKVLANNLPATIDIEVSAKGWYLMLYKYKQAKEIVQLDLKDAKALPQKNHFYLLSNDRLDKIRSQLNSSVKIVKIDPDTVFLNYNRKVSKKIPVKVNSDLSFELNYQLQDSVEYTPAFIMVSGAEDVINRINFIETELLSLNKINGSQIVEVKLKRNSILKQLEISSEKIQVSLKVKKYTEATVELPIEVVNLPAGYSLKTFPDKIQVRYNVAFDQYEKITSSLFKVVVDFNKIDNSDESVRVQLVKSPNEIRAVRLNPEKVEYIIKK